MQVSLETTSGLERRMHITVPSDEFESQVEAKLKQTAGQVSLKGFRPGKVPMKEVKRRFGPGIRQEVSTSLMESSYREAIIQEAVSPAGSPQIEDIKLETGQDLEFTAVFEVFPEITLADFSTIEVTRPEAIVTDADVEKMIETLREQRKEFSAVERAAQTEDKLNIDFEGFVDGEAFDGGKAEGSDIVIGSGGMIPGFEEGLVGAKAGEDTELNVTFPEEYQSSELAGKSAVFKVKVNSVLEAKLPELDETLFEQFGVTEGGLEAFKTEVTANMKKELKAAIATKIKNQVLDGLADSNEVLVPQALISSEIDRMRHEAIQQFGGQQQIDPSILPAEMFQDQASKRVVLGLLVNAIVEQKSLVVNPEMVKDKITEMASSYEDPEQVMNYYYSNEEQLNQVQNLVLEEQVIDTIVAEAKVTSESMGYDEAIKPVQAPEVEASEIESSEEDAIEAASQDAEEVKKED
ncbi:MAG: trigger factor [Candidatus Azotimanducaceae bacterium]|jgi:trigger factor